MTGPRAAFVAMALLLQPARPEIQRGGQPAWCPSLGEALQAAQKEWKPVLIDIGRPT